MQKISVVVPIYNVERYVSKCIESIQNQNYKNLDIILVDDGSTDNSGMICDRYAQSDKRIRVIHKENGGQISARKAGIDIAVGDYIIAVDGDDWIEEDWVDGLVKYSSISECDMYYMDGILRETNGQCYDTAMNLENRLFLGAEIENNVIPMLLQFECGPIKKIKLDAVSWAYKRELIKKQVKYVDNRLTICEDMVLVTRCIMNSNTLEIIPGGRYHYIQRLDSMSANPISEELALLIERELLFFLDETNASSKTKKIYKEMLNLNLSYINYDMLIQRSENGIPFFPQVKKGSKIIIYGAGRVGRNISKYVKKNNDYELVAIIDQNADLIDGVQDINVVDELEYDYIIIASIVGQYIVSMQNELQKHNVEQSKIAVMQPDL